MATTYGERLLQEAEGRARAQAQRRRLVFIFGPALIATLLAVRGIWGVRQASMSEAGAGLIRYLIDHGTTLGFAALFVLAPLWLALRSTVRRSPAIVALIGGPIAMPMVFGPGARLWHWAIVVIAAGLTISAARPAVRRRPTR